MEIEKLLKEGCFHNFELGKTSLEEVLEILGEYDDSEVSKHFADYYWENICVTFGVNEGTLSKIKVEFDDDINYETTEPNKTVFEKKMDLEAILLYLNYKQINYRISNPEIDFDYVFVNLDKNIRLTYYLPWKELIDISIISDF